MDERKAEHRLETELSELRQRFAEANRRLAEAEAQIAELKAECELLDGLRVTGEEQASQQERLAVVGQLAGGIAHDFGNFLTASIFHIELLLHDPRLSPELAPTVATLLDGSRRTAQLVRQILDFSRRTTLKTQPIDLSSFVDDVAAILRHTIPENIRLTIELEPGNHVASVDPARIEQVLMNLALNARDAMPEGGELRIGLHRVVTASDESLPGVELSLTEVPVRGMPAGEWVCLAVSDTGTGITEDVQKRLFEPFFTTKGEEGTGLGLAQVYSIVTQHDGHIGVESEVGRGATFRIYLPACGAEEAGMSARGMSAAPRGNGEVILFVEDEERIRELGQQILELLGYRVLVAGNGVDALEAHRAAGGVDLVITDMVMPEMGGQALVQKLRTVDPELKALAITGYPPASSEELAEIGVVGTVQKPFEVEDLAQAIRQALGGADAAPVS
jgi:two-component system cell cycle sensor histidine kinase/response regulator CckA